MTDYNKQTVANLRQLLKDRGIASTGLTRKAQIIEKLQEWDNRGDDTPAAAESSPTPVASQAEESPPEAEPAPVQEAAPLEDAQQDAREEDTASRTVKAASSEPVPVPARDHASPPSVPVPDATTTEEPHAEESAPPPGQDSAPVATTDGQSAQEEADRTPPPAPDEKESIEKPDLPTIPEQSAPSTADPSRLNSEEFEADTRKRKRRSLTPDIISQDPRAKKPRPSQNGSPKVVLKEDEDTVMEQAQPAGDEDNLDRKATNAGVEEELEEAEADGRRDGEDAIPNEEKPPSPELEKRGVPDKKEKAPRFRELFKPAAEAEPQEAIMDDRPIVPALHPATPAIYIRNFMRPLRPEPLRAHLVSLASPPSSSPNPNIVKALFLDAMKTHALVLLSNTTAASRVRASLHGSIWPPEGNRKELWVDFVPEDKIEAWIREEEDAIASEKEARQSGRFAPAKKFEVVYPEDANGEITAVFQEVGASALAFNPPKGPRRASQQVPPTPTQSKLTAPTQETRQDIEKSFKTLDELFLCTSAKPKLYYLPVSEDRSETRLKELDLETSRDWAPEERRRGRGMQGSRLDQKVRFSFNAEDRVVEAGGDFGPWAEDFRGGRGGFRGGRGGPRGRGGGWRSGPGMDR